jgi:hypothetical protein
VVYYLIMIRIEVEKDEMVVPRDFVSLGDLSRSVMEYTIYRVGIYMDVMQGLVLNRLHHRCTHADSWTSGVTAARDSVIDNTTSEPRLLLQRETSIPTSRITKFTCDTLTRVDQTRTQCPPPI